ncbi:MAG: hypothetical protein ACJ76S_02365 [Solirubrobacteraceae bacterium]
MTAFRLISLPAHAAFELVAGLALMATPFAFGFSPVGLVIAVTLGALVAGLALSAASRDGRGLTIAHHVAVDRLVVVALATGAAILAIHGDRSAAVALLAGAVTQLTLTLTTRYVGRA